MSAIGINEILLRVKTEKLIENLSNRELKNPEGVGVDLRLGAVYKITAGGAFILRDRVKGLGYRNGVKTEVIAQYQKRGRQKEIMIKPGDYYLVSTLETINTPEDLMPVIFPRTSLFRAGLLLLNSKT